MKKKLWKTFVLDFFLRRKYGFFLIYLFFDGDENFSPLARKFSSLVSFCSRRKVAVENLRIYVSSLTSTVGFRSIGSSKKKINWYSKWCVAGIHRSFRLQKFPFPPPPKISITQICFNSLSGGRDKINLHKLIRCIARIIHFEML